MPREAGRAVGLLVARICLAGLFLYTGVNQLRDLNRTAEALAAMGYPAPGVLALVAGIAQVAGAASLVLGLLTPLGCIALILFLLPTTYSFHLPGLLKGDVMQTIDTLKNLAIVGGLIALLFTGPGSISIDGRIMAGGGKR